MTEMTFQPGKTYATADNACTAAHKIAGQVSAHPEKFRFMVVGVPATEADGGPARYAPIFFGEWAIANGGGLANRGFTVIG